MQSFRMAGIDSQVVFRILELFGAKFFSKDTTGIFADQTECYEFAYLLIVLQTCQHNKSIKQKTTPLLFEKQAKEMVPKSYDKLPEGLVQKCFEAITDREIKAPITRNLVKGSFDLYEM